MKSTTTIDKNLSKPTARTAVAISIYSIVIAVLVLVGANTSLAGSVHGYVYTRDVVTNDAGNRIWARYNPETGAYEGDVGEAVGVRDPAQWRVMSGDEYRSYVNQKNALHNAQNDLVLMSRADFEAVTPPLLLADGITVLTKPSLGTTTAYVSILPQARRLIDDPTSLVLAEYPINPDLAIADDTFSMLHKFSGSDIGQISDATPFRIGFKVAFAKDGAGNPVPIAEGVTISGGNEYKAVGPIANAKIEALFSQTSSQEDGAFALFWYSVPCPGFFYSHDFLISLELQYRRFNPRARGNAGLYMDTYPVGETCSSSFYMVPFLGPFPTGWEITTYPRRAIQFAIDLTVLSGTAQLSADVSTAANRVTLSGNKIPVAATTQYQATSPDNSKNITSGYDFDRDGTTDTVQAGHFETDAQGVTQFLTTDPKELQGVWLSSSGNTPADSLPDITRVMDSASFSDYDHQGLLAQISAEDLRNTDIYVVRVSDGKLISERIGLNEYEANRISNFGEDANNSQFFYTIQMQGSTGDKRFYYRQFEEWQAGSGINPELHQRQSDHLQPGDAIRIYAINRATGYIGHADSVMQAGTLENADLSFHIDPIVMGPPNLKVRAERGYKIQSGATASPNTKTQLIGFEGASLTSDTTVSITTEWLDHEGRPLPESLEGAGYTGRIAILSADKTLPGGRGTSVDPNAQALPSNRGVYNFPIDPGRRLQVLQLPNVLESSDHFYIHVSGEPQSGNPIFAGSTDSVRLREADFSSSGQNPGILAKRPDNYVPFLTPVFDEVNTELQTQAYRQLMRDNPGQTYESPDPIYRWVYRPEMQFTSYDLKVKEIERGRDDNEDGVLQETEYTDILNDGLPTINSSSVINLLYDLGTTDLLPLDYFNAGAAQELVFVIGEQEVTATLGADQLLHFDDLSHLDLLNPDDFLTISLYANNDMGNVLWQWAYLLNVRVLDEDGEEVRDDASFSHPNPVVKIGIGSNQNDIAVTDLSVSGNIASVTIQGKVYCDIADIVEDASAGIQEVTLIVPRSNTTGGFERITIPVTNASTNELKDYLPATPNDIINGIEDLKHPFIGEFSANVNMELASGGVTVFVEAHNAIGNLGYDSFTVNTNITEAGVTVSSVVNHSNTGRGLFKPLWIQVEDAALTPGNIANSKITLFGSEQTLVSHTDEFGDIHYFVDRPFIQVARTFIRSIDAPNIINAVIQPESTVISYSSPELSTTGLTEADLQMSWSYTASSPPNFYKYAAGTTVGHKWYSNLLNDGWQVDTAEVFERTGYSWRNEVADLDSTYKTHNVLAEPLHGKNGVEFVIEFAKTAHTFTESRIQLSEKRLKITLTKDAETKVVDSAIFKVVPLKTIILAIDGFAYQSARDTIDNAPGFNKIFRNSVQHSKPALSALPTITWTNWPGVFSGDPPARHGILGNSYFPRENNEVNLKYPVYSAGQSATSRIDKKQQGGIVFGGAGAAYTSGVAHSMDRRALSGAGSIYDAIAERLGRNTPGSMPLKVKSIRVFYDRSGDSVSMNSSFFSVADPLGHSFADAAILDDGAGTPWPNFLPIIGDSVGTGPKAFSAWASLKHSYDIFSLYFPGSDNVGHGVGGGSIGDVTNPPPTIAQHAAGATNSALTKLINLIEHDGYMNAVLFAMTGDHGLHEYRNEPEFVLLTEEMETFFETPVIEGGLGMELWRAPLSEFLDTSYNNAQVVYSPNGGLAQFYIRSDGGTWQQPPNTEDIKRVASLLYRESIGHIGFNDRVGYLPTNQIYTDLAPKTPPPPLSTINGAFGSPPALFVRYADNLVSNNFMMDFRWVKGVIADPLDPNNNQNLDLGSIEEFLAARRLALESKGITDFDWPEFIERFNEMNHKNQNGSRTGDIVAVLDGRAGYLAVNTQDEVFPGWHGGPTVSESHVPLIFSMPGGSFMNSTGSSVSIPAKLTNGFNSGVTATAISANGHLRNWHLTPILREIINEFRDQ